MKESTLEMLCCPLCKGELELQIEARDNANVTEGSLTCNGCKNEYLVLNGIPRMYIPDNEVIALSNNSSFSESIITSENLDKWIKKSRPRKQPIVLTNQILTRILLLSGWFLFLSGILLLTLSSFDIPVANGIPLFVAYLLIGISMTLFIIDYLRYRWIAIAEYSKNLRTLKELSDQQELGEYYLHTATQDRDEDFKSEFTTQREFTAHKGKTIESILSKYNFRVENAINVGCGGALVKSVAEPYFDRGYDMVGVDVSEDYLKQFNQIFNADVVQANGVALPFGSNNFDLVNFTDILEHLHHPLLGLSEAQRVLKVGAVLILTTPNHCSCSRGCINPFLFVEKIISLYYDKLLPPRNILTHWMGINFYHTEFSKKQITSLIEAAGFEILSLETEFPNMDKLNNTLKKFPLLRFMAGEFVILGQKKQPERKNAWIETATFA